MNNTSGKSEAVASLRQQAEDLMKKKPTKSLSQLSEAETLKLIHELEVHQIELEMQNEELLRAKENAELAAQKHAALYDFAPSGYLTLSKDFEINNINICAAQMLGKDRSYLENTTLEQFLSDDSKPVYKQFLEKTFKSKSKEMCEVKLNVDGKTEEVLSLIGLAAEDGEKCFVTMVSITERKRAEKELRESEVKFRKSLDVTPIPIAVAKSNGDLVFFNKNFIDTFGYTLQDMPNIEQWFVLAYPDSEYRNFVITDWGKKVSDALKNNVATAASVYQAMCKNGEVKTVEISAFFEKEYSIGIFQDITERKRAEMAIWESEQRLVQEKALRESELFHSKMISNIGDVIVIIDGNGTNRYKSANIEKWFGWKPEDLIGHNAFANVHPDDLAKGLNFIGALALTQGASGTIELKYRCKAGNYKWIEVSVVNLLHDSSINGFLGNYHDITERKQAENALRESEKKAQSYLNLAVDIIISLNAQGDIMLLNDSGHALLGYAPGELIGKNWFKTCLPPDSVSAVFEVFKKLMNGESENVKYFENMVKTKNGSFRCISWQNTLLTDAENKACGLLSSGKDTTERKQAEELLLEINHRLQEATAKAKAANSAKSDFLANMSHEIRTPMNGVIGMTELLLDTELNENQKECALTVKKSADALLSIINDILDFSKIEAGKLELEEIDFDLNELIEGVVALFRQRCHAKGLELLLLIEEDVLSLLKGDPGRIRQILLNFMSNAIKFTTNGEVCLRISVDSSSSDKIMLRFAIKDTGIGISAEDQKRLFQSFQQADSSTTRKFGGTGLGLVISKKLAMMMHGDVGLQSENNVGSTFWFTAEFKKQAATAVLKPVQLQGVKIIAVADHPTHLEFLKIMLKPTGCHLDLSESPLEALRMMQEAAVAQQAHAVAIINLIMSEMDGKALGVKIKADERLQKTALVLMTSVPERGDGPKAQQIGFSAYLTKPTSRQQLIKTLELVLGRNSAIGSPTELKSELITRHTLHENALRTLRILVAEDNAINRMVLQKMLANMGFQSEYAENGKIAVDRLCAEDFDLVLMDCQMPEMDGYEATKVIRDPSSKVRHHNIPVIAITANAMIGDEEKCLAAGMNSYTTKPIKREALQQVIRAQLNAKKDGSHNVSTR